MTNSHLRLVAPTADFRTVMPRRLQNAELRTREYLTEAEVSAPQYAPSSDMIGFGECLAS
jgi:hypothetical protein